MTPVDPRIVAPTVRALIAAGVHSRSEIRIARGDVGQPATGAHDHAVVMIAELVRVAGAGRAGHSQRATESRLGLDHRERNGNPEKRAVIAVAIREILGFERLFERRPIHLRAAAHRLPEESLGAEADGDAQG